MSELENLKREYLRGVTERIQALERLQADLRSGKTAEAGAEIRRIAHKVAGSAGIYGFGVLSAVAGLVESAGDGDLPLRLKAFLGQLKEAALDRRNILVVEDDPDIHRLLKAKLAGARAQIWVAPSGAAALKILEDADVQVMFLDLNLPDMDGRALLREVRARPKNSALPIYVASAIKAPEVRAECLALGATGYILKPFDPDRLLEIAASHSGQESTTLEASATPPGPAAPGKPGTRAVLVADDDELIVSFIRHRLGGEGFQILEARDGSQALDLAGKHAVDLFILDIQMPGASGVDVLRALRAGRPHAKTPVMMLTALGGEKDIALAFEHGANDYLVKPFSPVELLARIRRLIRS